jgi:hypothetical protein
MMGDSVEDLAYGAAVAALDRQYASLTDIRARSATLLSAAALVAAFIGPDAIQANGESLSGWVAIGIGGLVAVMGLVLAILWPRRFVFRLKAEVILDDHAGPDSNAADVTAFLARALDGHHDLNERTLLQLQLFMRLACLAVGVETVALLLAV